LIANNSLIALTCFNPSSQLLFVISMIQGEASEVVVFRFASL